MKLTPSLQFPVRLETAGILLLLLGNMALFSNKLFARALSMTLDDSTIKERDSYRRSANLPDVQTWPHRPVFLQGGRDTFPKGRSEREPLPIGQPFEFETPLFKGKILVRLRNAKSDDPAGHDAYFAGRKRLKQIIVQGRFKEPMVMSDVYFGDVFERPLNPAPPQSTARIIKSAMSRLVPGLIMDLSSDKPKVLTLYAGCAHSLSVDPPGQEPSITNLDPPENTALLLGGEDFVSADKRKKMFSKPKYASEYMFNTEHVYTFHNYDDVVDMGQMTLRIPMLGKIDMANILNGQPLAISAVTGDGRFIFNFRVWHERLWGI